MTKSVIVKIFAILVLTVATAYVAIGINQAGVQAKNLKLTHEVVSAEASFIPGSSPVSIGACDDLVDTRITDSLGQSDGSGDEPERTCRSVRACKRKSDRAGNLSAPYDCKTYWICCYYGNPGAPRRCV